MSNLRSRSSPLAAPLLVALMFLGSSRADVVEDLDSLAKRFTKIPSATSVKLGTPERVQREKDEIVVLKEAGEKIGGIFRATPAKPKDVRAAARFLARTGRRDAGGIALEWAIVGNRKWAKVFDRIEEELGALQDAGEITEPEFDAVETSIAVRRREAKSGNG